MSEGLRGALNALLFRTGDQSKDFMVVLATNRPGTCVAGMPWVPMCQDAAQRKRSWPDAVVPLARPVP
jgi:hypothetical protein